MEIVERVAFLHELLEHLVGQVKVTITDPNSTIHRVCSNNFEEKAAVLAEHPELRVSVEALYKQVVYDRHMLLRFMDYKYVVRGQGKQYAKELKRELAYKMLNIS